MKKFMQIKQGLTLVGRTKVWVVALVLLVSSCDGLFEAEVTTNVVTDDIVRSGYVGAQLTARASYDRLVNVLDNVTIYAALASDEANAHTGQITLGELDLGTWGPASPDINFAYSGLHDARGQADRFLNEFFDLFDLTQNYPADGPNVDVRAQTLQAYATLMRGWSTLYLGFIFEEVNFEREAPVSSDEAIRRAITDFQAIESGYANGTYTEAVFEGISIREAANSLLAKAHLQLGDYPATLSALDRGFTQSTPTAGDDGELVAIFSSSGSINQINGNAIYSEAGNLNSPSKSWSMTSFYIGMGQLDARVAVDSTTANGDPFVPNADNDREEMGIALGYSSPVVLEKYLVDAVEDAGLRLLSWQDNALMRAEALIQSGQVSDGVTELNTVRAEARSPEGDPVALSTAATMQDALNDLLLERRLEFAAEVGDRFITLRRHGIQHGDSGRPHALPIPSTEF